MPLNFLGNLIGTGVNAQIAQNNLDLQKENLAYQKELQKQIFSREDSAIQRRVADLEKAGLSPVLASGQGANAGQAISTQAPQNQFQMAMNLLPTVGSLMDTFEKMYNAKWYASAGLPIGYNPSDLGSAFMMSMIGGKGDKMIDNSWSSIQRILKAFGVDLPNLGDAVDAVGDGFAGAVRDASRSRVAGSMYRAMATRGDSGGYKSHGKVDTILGAKRASRGYDMYRAMATRGDSGGWNSHFRFLGKSPRKIDKKADYWYGRRKGENSW